VTVLNTRIMDVETVEVGKNRFFLSGGDPLEATDYTSEQEGEYWKCFRGRII
jgi:hypothetical protein